MQRVLSILFLAAIAWLVYDWVQSDGDPSWRRSIPSWAPGALESEPAPQSAPVDANNPVEQANVVMMSAARNLGDRLLSSLDQSQHGLVDDMSNFRNMTDNPGLLPQHKVAARNLSHQFANIYSERERRVRSLENMRTREVASFRDNADQSRDFMLKDIERQWAEYGRQRSTIINNLINDLH